MLSSLHIENIAVIQRAEIEFGPGFNVLTGETGAGKSIVIDAISAVLGRRTSRDLVRTGAQRALVSAVFSDAPRLSWFEDNLIPYDESGQLQIVREISADGRGACRVNSRPVSVGLLRALGDGLMAIHGQHDSQTLFDEQNHLTILDGFAEDSGLLAEYTEAYALYSDLGRQIKELEMDEAEKARRIDSLGYQIAELEDAALRPGEDEELSARRKLLKNAGRLMDALNSAYIALSGGDDSDGAAALLSEAETELARIEEMSLDLAQLRSQVGELSVAADELAGELRAIREDYDFSEYELDQVEGRLDLLHRLGKKYGSSVDAMLQYLQSCKNELEAIEMSEDTLKKLQKKRDKAKGEAQNKAAALSDARKAAATRLQDRIMSELNQLDMPKVRFETEFNLTELSPLGMDQVRFLMSANLGEDLKPISKVASGGELARIMLAIKNVLAENDGIPTLIFDEVDSGVSGRAAVKVAQKLKAVSNGKQVLCVTHLPQIAARADQHFSIEKTESGGRTYTIVTPLDLRGRKMELARLIGGDKITETTLKSAQELMERN